VQAENGSLEQRVRELLAELARKDEALHRAAALSPTRRQSSHPTSTEEPTMADRRLNRGYGARTAMADRYAYTVARGDPPIDPNVVYEVLEAEYDLAPSPDRWSRFLVLTLTFDGGTKMRLFICPVVARVVFGSMGEEGTSFSNATGRATTNRTTTQSSLSTSPARESAGAPAHPADPCSTPMGPCGRRWKVLRRFSITSARRSSGRRGHMSDAPPLEAGGGALRMDQDVRGPCGGWEMSSSSSPVSLLFVFSATSA
jgi:hypothetical protein